MTPPAGPSDQSSIIKPKAAAKSWTLVVGYSRGLEIRKHFYEPLKHYMYTHTPFRRITGVEPVWLALFRGTVAVAFLMGLLVFGLDQCVWSPFTETDLPTRPRVLSAAIDYVREFNITVVLVRRLSKTLWCLLTLTTFADCVQLKWACSAGTG